MDRWAGLIERIVLLALCLCLCCVTGQRSAVETPPPAGCSALTNKRSQPSLSLSLFDFSYRLFSHTVWYALHVQTEILLFGQRSIKCNQNAGLLFVSTARCSYPIAFFSFHKGHSKRVGKCRICIFLITDCFKNVRGNQKAVFLPAPAFLCLSHCFSQSVICILPANLQTVARTFKAKSKVQMEWNSILLTW